MRTDRLIDLLAEDPSPARPVGLRLGLGLVLGLAASGAALLAFWGLRPDLGAALGSAVAAKTALPLALALAALGLARGLTQPENSGRGLGAALAAVVLAGAAAFAAFWLRNPVGPAGAAEDPDSLLFCLVSVPVLAVPLLAGLLWAMRAGATTVPARAGAVAGALAGGAAVALYSLYCTEDSPLFVLPVYGAALAITVAAGALLGRRLLRW